MNNALDELPVSITPVVGEALDSYLERLAAANDTPTPALTRRLHLAATPAQLRYSPPVIPGPAGGADWSLAGKRPPGVSNGWDAGAIVQACPVCLGTMGAWLAGWYDPMVTICLTHHVLLATACPGCRQPLRNQRAPLRTVAGTVCGNPLGAGRGPRCDTDLAALTAATADEKTIVQQEIYQRLPHAGLTLAGDVTVDTAGYRRELIALSVLLLHINDATGDRSGIPAAELSGQESRYEEAPTRRWSLSPPNTSAARSIVLTQAHYVLTRPTAQEAADAFAPHFARIPHCWEGSVTWAFEHTTSTELLARIIRIASSTRTRLSYQIDHHSHLGDVQVEHIPQVTPPAYRHLFEDSGLSAATGPAFATLCLARAQPDITTWAAAAEALSLPAEHGVDLARIASARMTFGPNKWMNALEELAALLTQDAVNYRDREAATRRTASHSQELVVALRAVRPGTRDSSADFAVIAVWELWACGHFDTNPAAAACTTRQAKANYRQFRASLTSRHLVPLVADTRNQLQQDPAKQQHR